MKTKGNILVVEDNHINLKLIQDILETQQYNVIEALDGKIALEIIDENIGTIDLILLDLQLPEIGGLEVIQRLQSKNSTKKIPIIVVSAHAMESDIKKCKEAGCYDYITKPININGFINKINSFFEALSR